MFWTYKIWRDLSLNGSQGITYNATIPRVFDINKCGLRSHYRDVIMSAMASQITPVSNVCSTVCSRADQRKHQSSVSLAFVMGIHRWPVDSTHKGPVTRKTFPFDDVIMVWEAYTICCSTHASVRRWYALLFWLYEKASLTAFNFVLLWVVCCWM